MPPLVIVDLHMTVRCLGSLHWPAYAGSMLRGVYGRALRQLLCTTHRNHCQGCPEQLQCGYAKQFEAAPTAALQQSRYQQAPSAYLVLPPLRHEGKLSAGDTFDWTLRLINPSRDALAASAAACQRALDYGFGSAHVLCELVSLKTHEHDMTLTEAPQEQISLEFVTPLRLQRQKQLIGADELTAPLLIEALLKRADLVMRQHSDQNQGWPNFDHLWAEAKNTAFSEKRLHWQDWHRASLRRKQGMTLGGLMGHVSLTGNWQAFWPLLRFGELIHVGKNTVFGLGRFKVNFEQLDLARSSSEFDQLFENDQNQHAPLQTTDCIDVSTMQQSVDCPVN